MRPGDRLVAAAQGVAAAKALVSAFIDPKIGPVRDPVEIVEQRTMRGKTFDLGNGEFHHSSRLMPAHCKADPNDEKSPWEDIDLTLAETGKNTYGFPNSFYGIAIRSDVVSYTYTSRRGHVTTVSLQSVADARPDYSQMTFEVEENRFTWHYAPGVDFYILCRPGYAELFKVLKDETSAKAYEWAVEEDDDDNPERPAQFVRLTAGKDASTATGEGAIELLNAVASETKDKGRRTFTFREEWTGKVARVVNAQTRQKAYQLDPVYPVVVDATITEHVAADADDGYEGGGSWFPSGNAFRTGNHYVTYNGGTRFTTIAIAQGATVSLATLTVNQTFVHGTPGGKIYADNVDSAAAWAAGNRPGGITKTTASTTIAPSGTGTKVYTVTSLVQEVVNRAGWVSNNDMRFGWISTSTTGYHEARWEDYHAVGTAEAVLDITYTAGGGAVNPPDTRHVVRQAAMRAGSR